MRPDLMKVNAPTRANRHQQAMSYEDLMKPDEDWRNLPNASDRRRIQNRLAQRAYRRNMRDRAREVERLKEKLSRLEEGKREGEEDVGPASGSSTPSLEEGGSELPTMAPSEWMGRFLYEEEPEVVESMDTPSSGRGLRQPDRALCTTDHPPSSDYPPQAIPPGPMVSEAQRISPPDDPALSLQGYPGQPKNNEFLFHYEGMGAMPWPEQQDEMFEAALRAPAVSAQAGRMLLPSPPISHGPQDPSTMLRPIYQDQRQSKAYKNLLDLEGMFPSDGAARASYVASPPTSELGEYPWYRPKLSPSPAALPPPPPTTAKAAPPKPTMPPTKPPPPPPPPPLAKPLTPHDSCSSTPQSSASVTTSPRMKDKEAIGGGGGGGGGPRAEGCAGSGAEQKKMSSSPSLLHLAVAGGHTDTLTLLLQRLDTEALNARDERGFTVLECAVMEGRTELVAILLAHGAAVSPR